MGAVGLVRDRVTAGSLGACGPVSADERRWWTPNHRRPRGSRMLVELRLDGCRSWLGIGLASQ